VINSGTINAANDGILLDAPGSVTNSGNITAGVDAISLPSGSSLTLTGLPTITGVISGGATSASTSTLAFDLAIPADQMAAAAAQLGVEIQAYGAQDGGNYTFVIDGLTFDVSNFDYTAITDDFGGATPEPSVWGMLLTALGCGWIGSRLRRKTAPIE
jgi:hypothetical protein